MSRKEVTELVAKLGIGDSKDGIVNLDDQEPDLLREYADVAGRNPATFGAILFGHIDDKSRHKAVLSLAHYAQVSAQAKELRVGGRIEAALAAEEHCNKVYEVLIPRWARW